MVDQKFLDSLVFRKARLSDAGKVFRLVRELAGDVSDAAAREEIPSYCPKAELHQLLLAVEGQHRP